MQRSNFDFDVITGPSVPQDRKPAPQPSQPTQPATAAPAPQRSR